MIRRRGREGNRTNQGKEDVFPQSAKKIRILGGGWGSKMINSKIVKKEEGKYGGSLL